MTPNEFISTEVQTAHQGADSKRPSRRILVSLGTCGIAAGAQEVLNAFSALTASRPQEDIKVVGVGCLGLCYCEPTVEVVDETTGTSEIFSSVKPADVAAILEGKGTKANRTWYFPEDEEHKPGTLQARIALKNSGRIDPESIDEALAHGGYAALKKALLNLSSTDVVNIITESGLRGRGGGGFPTGKKWAIAAAQQSDEKFLVCNADEGDPGAFMDRAVLEGDPHTLIEAMVIAGYAIGARKGIVYVRAEYPLAVKRLKLAIEDAEKHGFLGNNILGSEFSFHLSIKYGAGAFVCGEETALIRSIAGMRGMPVSKPPFPAIKGLWEKPTIVNNVETFANVPAIIRKGAKWFRSLGTEGSPGTKVFSVTGKVNNVGLVEVPMGTTLRDMIFELGGGIRGGKKFKAVQTGGPSGGCIAEENLDTPIDYDSLRALGSMMGSGGMIVMDEDDCMVDVARFFIQFTMDESCGKCTPCRVGGRQLFGLLNKIVRGEANEGDLNSLRTLCDAMRATALCGLGNTAPNPVIATLKCFESEYLAHIHDRRCPAGKCAELVNYSISIDKCKGCRLCAKKCPVECISGELKQPHVIDAEKCIRCGSCLEVCKFGAVIRT